MSNKRYVTIKTESGTYLKPTPGKNQLWASDNSKYFFEVTDHGSNKISLKIGTGKFVSAKDGGGGLVTIDRDSPRTWETFTLIHQEGSKVSFLCHNNVNFLQVEGAEEVVTAKARGISKISRFTIEWSTDTPAYFK